MSANRETVRRAALVSALVGAAITGVGAVMATYEDLLVESRWPLIAGGLIVIASVVQTQASKTVRIDARRDQWA